MKKEEMEKKGREEKKRLLNIQNTTLKWECCALFKDHLSE